MRLRREYRAVVRAAPGATGNKYPGPSLEHAQIELEARRIRDLEIERLESDYWIEHAHKLLVPLPPAPLDALDSNEFWECGPPLERTGQPAFYKLSRRGLEDLRSRVRRERKERSERFFRFSAAITGVIGALTGLVALIGVILG